MSIFGDIIDDTLNRLGASGFRSGLYHVVQAGVGLGLSANAIQRQLSAAGVGIARQTLQSLVRQVRANGETGTGTEAIDTSTLPGPEHVRQVPGGKAGMFRTQVSVIFRRNEGAGIYTTETTVFSIAADQLMSPDQAMDIAESAWAAHSESYDDTELLGMTYVGTVQNMGGS